MGKKGRKKRYRVYEAVASDQAEVGRSSFLKHYTP
jgi:hypothetical protein